MTGRRIVLVEPAAQTSHEHELWRSLPDSQLTVISDRAGWDADRTVELAVRRVPVLGRPERWTAALAWMQGLERHDMGPTDLVVSVELFSPFSIQAARLARRLQVPHVVSVAETLPDFPLYRLPPYRQMTKRLAAGADLFVCLTDRARDAAVSVGCARDRCVTVRPGVDTSLFQPAEAGLAENPRVLFVGMLRSDVGADKGVQDIVDACEQLVPHHPGLELVLVGDGPLRGAIERQAASRPFLTVAGRIPRRQLPGVMQASRCLVLASRRTWKWEEQFGFVLAEAMASGLPVVGTRSGAIPEVVAPGNPLVDPGDGPALAEAISRCLGPAGQELAATNRAFAEAEYDLVMQGRRLDRALTSHLGLPPAKEPAS